MISSLCIKLPICRNGAHGCDCQCGLGERLPYFRTSCFKANNGLGKDARSKKGKKKEDEKTKKMKKKKIKKTKRKKKLKKEYEKTKKKKMKKEDETKAKQKKKSKNKVYLFLEN